MTIDVRKKDIGQVFTPPELVDLTLEQVGYNDSHIIGKYILEPSFGDGMFLEEIVRRIIKYSPLEDLEKNLSYVYGWEIDNSLYNETLVNLNNLIEPLNINIKWNLECTNTIFKMGDYKGLFGTKNILKFDYIVGNPPYVIKRNIDDETKKSIKAYYNYCHNSYDLYYAFFEIALFLLKDDGEISFITPSTYFYNSSAEKLRQVFKNKKYVANIIDFKRHLVFKNIWTFVCITTLNKKERTEFKYSYSTDADPYKFNTKLINYNKIDDNSWAFSNDYSKEGKPINELVNTYQALGTQKDRIFIVKIESEKDNYAIVSSRYEKSFKIEKSILKKVIKVSKQKSLDGLITEYIIFPYEKDLNGYSLISEIDFKTKYPLGYKYLYKYKESLEKRTVRKWYSANDSFMRKLEILKGKKVIFSYVMNAPNKFVFRDDDEIYYSGFIMKLKDPNGSFDDLVKQINSKEAWGYFSDRFTTIKNGWSRVKLNIVKSFKIN